MIRLSLLPTGPPPVFQHWWVRPSTARYGRFSLPMGSSPGFASTAPDKLARLRLAFAPAPPLKGLTTPGTVTRRIIMQKARGQAGPEARRPPTARRHGVSGSVSSPGRGSSHRSVALLGSLSVVIEYLALRDGPRRFRPGFTCPTLLGYRLGEVASSPTGLSPAPVPLSSGLRLTLAHPMSPAPRPRVVSHPV